VTLAKDRLAGKEVLSDRAKQVVIERRGGIEEAGED